jgi:hypothetical protein
VCTHSCAAHLDASDQTFATRPAWRYVLHGVIVVISRAFFHGKIKKKALLITARNVLHVRNNKQCVICAYG